jgi:GMP synthase (glutamine-hydrolysing)
MKKILIIKTGCMPKEIINLHGDMEYFFIKGMVLPEKSFIISNVFDGVDLPDFNETSGIIITGSSAMATDNHEWIRKTALKLRDAIERNIPILGVCFGHQLLVHALGGTVSYNPNGREIGTVKIQLNEKAENDELFEIFSEPEIKVQVSHSQSVAKLPKEAELLALNSHERHHAFRVKNKKAWGCQFHPELDAGTIKLLIKFYQKQIEKEGLDPEKLSKRCIETQYGERLLKRFAKIIIKNENT